MKWILVLFLIGPNGAVQDAKVYPDMPSKEACTENGKAAEHYYEERGLHVVHKCLTEV